MEAGGGEAVEARLDEYKARVRAEWDADETVAAWRRWHGPFAAQQAAATEAVVRAGRPVEGDRVLDLACGSGEPAVSLARAVGPSGTVTATDMSEGMVDVARESAAKAGVENVRFQVEDAESLSFDDGSFELVTCRFGVMYFPRYVAALQEAARVLTSGGRIALVAWGSPTQPLFANTVGVLMASLNPPPPPPPDDAPTPFRFARPGSLTEALDQAGFTNARDETLTVPLPWPGPAEELWQHVKDIAAPFRPLIEGLGERRERVESEIVANLRRFEKDGHLEMTAEIVLASGIKP